MEYIWLMAGFILLILGADWMVQSASSLAKSFGVSAMVVGLISAKRREHDLMIGNIIGSNIFNILFVIGLSSMIHPISLPAGIQWSLVFMLATSVLFLILAHRQKRVSRPEGVLLLVVYIAFIILSLTSRGIGS